MFESYIMTLAIETIKLRETNEASVKEKLGIYRGLSKNFTKSEVDDTLKIINYQYETFQELRNVSNSLLDWRGISLTPQVQELITLLNNALALLERLIAALQRQKSALTSANPAMVAVQTYRSSFKEELSVYKEYLLLSRSFPADFIKKVRKELAATNVNRNLHSFFQRIIVSMVILGFLGAISIPIFRKYFEDLDTLLKGIGGVLIGSVIYMGIKNLPRLLRQLRSRRKK